MSQTITSLEQLGWKPFFQLQLSLEELANLKTGRIIEQHRDRAVMITSEGSFNLVMTHNTEKVCVGDWILFNDNLQLHRVLERQSLFERKAPGSKIDTQLIASNIDTVMIVTSLNQDFNLSRIERYLVLAREAMVEPVILLTKADLCENLEEKYRQVQKLDPLLMVHALNALDEEDIKQLDPYKKDGKTIVFLGSSGVGKSTLINRLLKNEQMQTGSIREDDSKGRHTTTHRELSLLPEGGILMDTPGMRELQLNYSEQGVSDTFHEILEMAQACRFVSCHHESEPGCQIQAAIQSGELSQRRFTSYQKLMREQAINGLSLADKRTKDKALGKLINTAQSRAKKYKKGY